MDTRQSVSKIFILILIFVGSASTVYSQCQTWLGLPEEERLIASYMLFKDYLKEQQYEEAYDYWLDVYEKAPAADGKRNAVYSGGLELLMAKFQKAIDREIKKEIARLIRELVAQENNCYPNMEMELPPTGILNYN